MKTKIAATAPLALALFLAPFAAAAAPPQPRSDPEDAPTRWVVFPARAGEDDAKAQLVRRFLLKAIEARLPQLEPSGTRIGGLIFSLKPGADPARSADVLPALQALPGVVGAIPLPSPSQALRAQAKATIAGGITSRAAGLIVHYRSAEKRAAARDGGTLASAELARLASVAGVEIVRSRAMSGEAYVLDFPQDIGLREAQLAALRLEQDPAIDRASANSYSMPAMTPNDPSFGIQWNLTNPVSGINVQPAWDITTGSSQVVVSVVDTGVLNHPEFSGRLIPGYDFITDPARARDGDGRDADPTDAGDWRPAGACGAGSAADDSTWHGTHVTGIIGATGNNGIGIAGINWQSRIQPVRVLGRCGGTLADILDGLRWAAGIHVPGVPDNPTPAWVINASISGAGNCIADAPDYQLAILEALENGATVVVAAGNDGESALSHVPSSCVGTIKVAAVSPSGDKTWYSNYSPAIEVAAPGGDDRFGDQGEIYSTFASGTQSDPGQLTWHIDQGTSMAAPHVTGVASLILSRRPDLTVAAVRELIRVTARPFPAGSACATNKDCGLGIVDAGKALAAAPQVVSRLNFSDLWWVPSESGWGLNLQQQGDILFGTWFTYGPDGSGVWLVMPSMARISQDFFSGDIYQTTGTPFNLINGSQASTGATKVGTAIVAFFGVGYNINPNLSFDSAIFFYEVGNASGMKPIGRQIFATPAVCRFTTGSRAASTNYQDLWWNPSESGWGINLAHQSDTIFATWFTYGSNGGGVWLVGPSVQKTANGVYNGRVYQTTGVPFNQIDDATAIKTATDVGQITLTFADGEHGRLDYQVAGISGSKQIVRQVFSSPLTTCQ